MLPIRDQALAISKIAEYVSRETGQVRTRDEVLDELLQAFWRGDLRSGAATRDHRRNMLRLISKHRQHPGLVVVDRPDLIPPQFERDPDGSVILDPHSYIVLPTDPGLWTESH